MVSRFELGYNRPADCVSNDQIAKFNREFANSAVKIAAKKVADGKGMKIPPKAKPQTGEPKSNEVINLFNVSVSSDEDVDM